jgi:hypothetical protein
LAPVIKRSRSNIAETTCQRNDVGGKEDQSEYHREFDAWREDVVSHQGRDPDDLLRRLRRPPNSP